MAERDGLDSDLGRDLRALYGHRDVAGPDVPADLSELTGASRRRDGVAGRGGSGLIRLVAGPAGLGAGVAAAAVLVVAVGVWAVGGRGGSPGPRDLAMADGASTPDAVVAESVDQSSSSEMSEFARTVEAPESLLDEPTAAPSLAGRVDASPPFAAEADPFDLDGSGRVDVLDAIAARTAGTDAQAILRRVTRINGAAGAEG